MVLLILVSWIYKQVLSAYVYHNLGQHRNAGTLETKNFHFQKNVISRRNKIFFELDT
jgi:hypothetical protein